MNDPPRLRDQSNNPLISEMLSAAGRQEPPRRAMRSTLLAAATAASVVGGQATAGAAVASTTALSLTKLAVKWTLLSVVVVGGGVAGVESSGLLDDRGVAGVTAGRAGAERGAGAERNAAGAKRGVSPSVGAQQQPAQAPARAESGAAFPDAVAPEPARWPPSASVPLRPKALPPTQVRSERLEREVALLDEARNALSQERYADVRRISDRYLAAYPGGTLEQEARYMKMQAARHLGDRARAQSEARALLELNPNGPHAKAARELYPQNE